MIEFTKEEVLMLINSISKMEGFLLSLRSYESKDIKSELLEPVNLLIDKLINRGVQFIIFAIDFDGSVVTHEYPNIGKDIGAEPVLKYLIEDGHQLILWTMRGGQELADAVKWFNDRDIPLYGVNENPTQKEWTDSPKVFAQIYIDDAAIGVPLIYPDEGRPYINWSLVNLMVRQ